ARNAGFTLIVDEDEAALVQRHTTVGGQQVGSHRAAADGDNQFVEGQLLLAGGVSKGHGDLLLLHFAAGHAGTQTDIQTLLAEDLQGFFGDLLVGSSKELVHGFQHGHFGTQAGPYRAQLQADNASADHAQLLRHGLEFQGAGGVDDHIL